MHHLPPDKIKDKLNNLFASQRSGIAARIARVRFSRKMNLVLTVVPTFATKGILVSDWTSRLATIGCLRDCLGLSETATKSTRIYPADPWHRVVIQNIPLRNDLQDPEENL